jgi:hypothetical protein
MIALNSLIESYLDSFYDDDHENTSIHLVSIRDSLEDRKELIKDVYSNTEFLGALSRHLREESSSVETMVQQKNYQTILQVIILMKNQDLGRFLERSIEFSFPSNIVDTLLLFFNHMKKEIAQSQDIIIKIMKIIQLYLQHQLLLESELITTIPLLVENLNLLTPEQAGISLECCILAFENKDDNGGMFLDVETIKEIWKQLQQYLRNFTHGKNLNNDHDRRISLVLQLLAIIISRVPSAELRPETCPSIATLFKLLHTSDSGIRDLSIRLLSRFSNYKDLLSTMHEFSFDLLALNHIISLHWNTTISKDLGDLCIALANDDQCAPILLYGIKGTNKTGSNIDAVFARLVRYPGDDLLSKYLYGLLEYSKDFQLQVSSTGKKLPKSTVGMYLRDLIEAFKRVTHAIQDQPAMPSLDKPSSSTLESSLGHILGCLGSLTRDDLTRNPPPLSSISVFTRDDGLMDQLQYCLDTSSSLHPYVTLQALYLLSVLCQDDEARGHLQTSPAILNLVLRSIQVHASREDDIVIQGLICFRSICYLYSSSDNDASLGDPASSKPLKGNKLLQAFFSTLVTDLEAIQPTSLYSWWLDWLISTVATLPIDSIFDVAQDSSIPTVEMHALSCFHLIQHSLEGWEEFESVSTYMISSLFFQLNPEWRGLIALNEHE